MSAPVTSRSTTRRKAPPRTVATFSLAFGNYKIEANDASFMLVLTSETPDTGKGRRLLYLVDGGPV